MDNTTESRLDEHQDTVEIAGYEAALSAVVASVSAVLLAVIVAAFYLIIRQRRRPKTFGERVGEALYTSRDATMKAIEGLQREIEHLRHEIEGRR